MPRLLAVQVALFVLPFVYVVLWRRIRFGRAAPRLTLSTFLSTLLAGFGQRIPSFVVLALTGGVTDPGAYQPLRVENGRVVPGELNAGEING